MRKETAARQVFLAMGIERINSFKTESVVLKNEIITKNNYLRDKMQVIDDLIDQLIKDQKMIEEEQKEVYKKKKRLEDGIGESNEKKMLINHKLKNVEYFLDESRDALSQINKGHLSEIKTMSSPPLIIKDTIEFVYYLLEGKKSSEWRELLAYIKKDDFISKVMNYLENATVCDSYCGKSNANGTGFCSSTYDLVILEFFENNTFEKAVKASKACGALFKWAKACIEFKKVNREVYPLRMEIGLLESSISTQSTGLECEEKALVELTLGLKTKQDHHMELSIEFEDIKKEILAKEEKLNLLDLVIDKIKDETNDWMFVEYKCPINEITNYVFSDVFNSKKNIFALAEENIKDIIRVGMDGNGNACGNWNAGGNGDAGSKLDMIHKIIENTENIVESNHERNKFVCVSLNDRNYKRVFSNAMAYNRAVFVEDCDRYDPYLYALLRRQIEGDQGQPVIVQGAYANYYKMETYEYVKKASFGTQGGLGLNEAEEVLLSLLKYGNDLQAISSQKDILDAKRAKEQQGWSLEVYSDRMADYYEEIDDHFKKNYSFGTSLIIFKEFLEKNGIIHVNGKDLLTKNTEKDKIGSFYSQSFINIFSIVGNNIGVDKSYTNLIGVDKSYTNLIGVDTSYTDNIHFTINEPMNYSFDYMFLTSFNDIIYDLKRTFSFDTEISAGVSENNTEIFSLLSEASNKLVLVKNTHFLPPVIKTGTNRFFFVMENKETHPLLANCRVVICDRNMHYDLVFKRLSAMFDSENDILKLHALLISLGMEFSLNDLETALKNNTLKKEFLMDTIYFNRIDKGKANEIKKLFDIIIDKYQQ